QLKLHAIDLVALVKTGDPRAASKTVIPHADDAAGKGSELDRRIAEVALAGAPQRGDVIINYQRDPGWTPEMRSLAELLEVARAASAVLDGARPLLPADLVTPEKRTSLAPVILPEATGRATAAATALRDAK